MTDTIQDQLGALRELRLPDLQARFAELVGEQTRCPNKTYLLKRISEALRARATASPLSPEATSCDAAPSHEDDVAETQASVDDRGDVSDVEARAPADHPVARDDVRLRDLDVDQLRARYVEVVGRGTSSHDRRYLIWKIRQAAEGKVPVGPVGRRQPGEPPVEHKVLPLRMSAETVEALDDVWRRHGLKSRMDLFRHALDQYLTGLGEEAAAVRMRRR